MRIAVLPHAFDVYGDEERRGFHARKMGDAGVDLRSTQEMELDAYQTKLMPLGVAIELPWSTMGWVTGRSSTLLSMGLQSHAGVIDSGYRGEIHAAFTALDRRITIPRGERVAQLVVLSILGPAWETVDYADINTGTERGVSGLGSTGRA